MDPERIQPIAVPAGWDTAQDLANFEDWWGEPTLDYTTVLWRMLDFHVGVFTRALDGCLYYFQKRKFVDFHVSPRCLTPAEIIEVLLEAVRRPPELAALREALIDDLTACAFSERERQRILREHRLAGERAWLYPVVELIDYLGGAGVLLDETLRGGAEGYEEVIQDLPSRDDPGFCF